MPKLSKQRRERIRDRVLQNSEPVVTLGRDDVLALLDDLEEAER